jgi:AcrR family transcriptional regulator
VLQSGSFVTGEVIMANEKINPSSRQSKKWIAESFFDMLAIRPLSSITISEIAENAGLDRRTFYRHFKSKQEVISYSIHEVSKQYEEKISRYDNVNDPYSIAKSIFEVLVIIKENLQILYKQNLLNVFLTDFEIIFDKYQYKYTSPEMLKWENIDFFLTFQKGGVTNNDKKWITEGCTYSPEEMGKIFEWLFFPDKKYLYPIE